MTANSLSALAELRKSNRWASKSYSRVHLQLKNVPGTTCTRLPNQRLYFCRINSGNVYSALGPTHAPLVNSSLQLSVEQLRTILTSTAASAHASGGCLLGSTLFGSSGLLALFAGLSWGSKSGLLLLEGGGDNVGRHTEGLGEEGDTLVSHGVVGPLPVEHLGEETLGGEGLNDHLDLEVGDISDVLASVERVHSDEDI